jgi:hypothetical protein
MWLAQFVCAPQFFKTPKGLCGHTVFIWNISIISVQWLLGHLVLSRVYEACLYAGGQQFKTPFMKYGKLNCRADNTIRTPGWCRFRNRQSCSDSCPTEHKSFVRRSEWSDSLLHMSIRSADVFPIFSSDTDACVAISYCNVMWYQYQYSTSLEYILSFL